jgi:Flp pilus assembly protein TadD
MHAEIPSTSLNPLPFDRSTFVAQLRSELDALPDLLMKMLPDMERGTTLAEIRGMSDDDLEDIYRVAYELCEEESWEDALPVLLYLIAHSPTDSRFQFAVGMCFQQTGQTMAACMAYAQALMLNPKDANSAFRMAESLAELGDLERAAEAFESAYAVAQEDTSRFRHLAELSHVRAQELRGAQA